MATLDDILSGGRKRPVVAPSESPIIPAIDSSMSGAPAPIGVNGVDVKEYLQEAYGKMGSSVKTQQSAASGGNSGEDGGNNGLSYVDLFKQLNPYKPPTPEEVELEKKTQKRNTIFSAIGDGISAMSNLYYTSRYSPHAWDHTASMSKKTRERWDRVQKEREANNRAYMDGYLRAMAMDDEKGRDNRNWLHMLKREAIDDKRYDAGIIYRDEKDAKDAEWRQTQWEHQLEREGIEDEWRKKEFEEGVRRAKVEASLAQQRINLEMSRFGDELKKDHTAFVLGDDKGLIEIPNYRLNSQTIGYIFNKIPYDVRKYVVGKGTKVKEPVLLPSGMKTGEYKEVIKWSKPGEQEMLVAIGTYVSQYPEVEQAIRDVGGQMIKHGSGRATATGGNAPAEPGKNGRATILKPEAGNNGKKKNRLGL